MVMCKPPAPPSQPPPHSSFFRFDPVPGPGSTSSRWAASPPFQSCGAPPTPSTPRPPQAQNPEKGEVAFWAEMGGKNDTKTTMRRRGGCGCGCTRRPQKRRCGRSGGRARSTGPRGMAAFRCVLRGLLTADAASLSVSRDARRGISGSRAATLELIPHPTHPRTLRTVFHFCSGFYPRVSSFGQGARWESVSTYTRTSVQEYPLP